MLLDIKLNIHRTHAAWILWCTVAESEEKSKDSSNSRLKLVGNVCTTGLAQVVKRGFWQLNLDKVCFLFSMTDCAVLWLQWYRKDRGLILDQQHGSWNFFVQNTGAWNWSNFDMFLFHSFPYIKSYNCHYGGSFNETTSCGYNMYYHIVII